MSRNYRLIYVGLFACMCSDAADAAILYSQVGPQAPIGAYSSNDTPTGQKIADNFLFNAPGSTTIRSIRFIGGYINRTPPPPTPPLNALPPDDFRVVFFADSAGEPGAPLASGEFHVGVPVQRAATGAPQLNGIVTALEYFIDLGAGITVNPATPYWMSVVNDPGPSYGWAWANTAGAFDQGVAGTMGDILTGPWSVSSAGGMFFEIYDNNVPEPSSLILIFVTVGGIRCFLRRR